MKPYQERVVTEHNELTERIEKLEIFHNSPKRRELEPVDQGLLADQLHAMLTYKQALFERIQRFT